MMPIQIRPTLGEMGPAIGVKYAPARDIVYLYPALTQAAEDYLWAGTEAPLEKWMKQEGVTEDERAEAVRAFCIFLNSSWKDPEDDVTSALGKSGFLSVPPAARCAFLAYLGMAVGGTFFRGVRDAHQLGAEEAAPPIERLVETAQEVVAYQRVRQWLKPFYRLKKRLWPRRRRYSVNH